MSVAKHVEITSASTKSFEDAIKTGIRKMAETVKNIEAVWVKEQKVVVKGSEISEYRVTMKVTFIIK